MSDLHPLDFMLIEPQRSPLHEGAETADATMRHARMTPSLNEVRSMKERRQLGGLAPGTLWGRLNEVRSMKERRLDNLMDMAGGESEPQRSPLHEGAETAG